MKLTAIALLSLLLPAAPVWAGDWSVLPASAWSGDATVNVEYHYAANSPTGASIGTAQLLIGPLLLGTPRPVLATQFEGTGSTVCLVADAVRGAVKSLEVSSCQSFPLAPPVVSHP